MAYTADSESEAAPKESEGKGEDAKSGHKKLIDQAKERFKLVKEAEHDIREAASDDKRFRSGEQWPQEIRAARELDGRPCLTVNKMPQLVQQVTNDQRQNRPSIKVHPVDDKADKETARVYQGMIRHIEVNSNADAAYDTGFENAVTGGYGFWRVITEYESHDSFNLDILIKRLRDANTAYLDPNHQEPDGSDANWGFVFERISKDDYRSKYGETALGKATDSEWDDYARDSDGWIEDSTCLVVEYFYKEFETKQICLLSTGQVVFKEEAGQVIAILAAQGVKATIKDERSAQIPTIKWAKLNGCEVLEDTVWPGRWIPIVPTYGAELIVDGKLIRESLIRHAKDPARMYNFWKSAETEAITLAPKAPFVGEEHQFEGYEADWTTANRKNHAFLKYKAFAVNGTPLPPPQRQNFEPAIQAITQASMLASDEVKQTTGLYDAAVGARSNETSGVAIQRRNMQAQTSNFHFTDNLTRSIKHTGRILVDLIPKVYDTARIARIIGDDGAQEVVRVNDPNFKTKSGEPAHYNLGAGKYDVTVDVGPSFATKRQEASEYMMEFAKAVPAAAAVTGDLIAKNQDWPGAEEFAERLKKTLPPGLADDPEAEGQKVPPQVQAQLTQAGQMIEQLTAQLNEAKDTIQQKRIELESKERIEMAKIERDYEIARAQLDAKDGLALLNAQIKQIEAQLAALNFGAPIQDVTADNAAPMGASGPEVMPAEPVGAYDGAEYGDGGIDPAGGGSPAQPMDGFEP